MDHSGLVHQYGIPRAARNLRSGAIILTNDFWDIFIKKYFRKELSLRSAESSIKFLWIRSYTKFRPKTLFLSHFTFFDDSSQKVRYGSLLGIPRKAAHPLFWSEIHLRDSLFISRNDFRHIAFLNLPVDLLKFTSCIRKTRCRNIITFGKPLFRSPDSTRLYSSDWTYNIQNGL